MCLHAFYPVVICVFARVYVLQSLPSDFLYFSACAWIAPCPNCTKYMIVFRDSLLVLYHGVICTFLPMCLHQTLARTVQSTQWLFVIPLICMHQAFPQTSQYTRWLLPSTGYFQSAQHFFNVNKINFQG